jgi:ubiquinone/menaquinone biosynthesis methyltransferase
LENKYEPEYIKDLFNRMSGSYERMNYITSFGFSLRWRHQFLAVLKPSTSKLQILDLMTGMGETWNQVYKHYPNVQLSTLDFSEGMLKVAEARNKKYHQEQVNIIHQNVLENNLPDNHFDIIISAFGLKTFNESQLQKLASETRRLLKSGGNFSFVEVSEPKYRILRMAYKLYLKHIIPILGRLLLGNPQEYKMLWQYTNAFKNSDHVVKIFKEAGLEVKRLSFFGDCASGIVGNKAFE